MYQKFIPITILSYTYTSSVRESKNKLDASLSLCTLTSILGFIKNNNNNNNNNELICSDLIQIFNLNLKLSIFNWRLMELSLLSVDTGKMFCYKLFGPLHHATTIYLNMMHTYQPQIMTLIIDFSGILDPTKYNRNKKSEIPYVN